jgi:phosphoglycerate dehydrogenase-like enzyme
VNVARGGLMEYDAVTAALNSGHLGGLGTDVTWVEPVDPHDPILQHPNVIVTPHVAGVSEHSYQRMSQVSSLR